MEEKRNVVHVVAAVIRRGDRVFATERGKGPLRGGWEFPGGKVEPGETPEQALRREILEELDTEIEVLERMEVVEYDYPDFHLFMECFWCVPLRGSLELREALDARWLGAKELESVPWLPADRGLIRTIARSLSGMEKNTPQGR